VKAQLEALKAWRTSVDDGPRHPGKLYDLEPDEELLPKPWRPAKPSRPSLARWSWSGLLSGHLTTKEGAVISIKAGRGGTDAQGWAFDADAQCTPLGRRHGMKVSVNELRKGEEAGIKTARSRSWPYARLSAQRKGHPPAWCGFTVNANDKQPDQLSGAR